MGRETPPCAGLHYPGGNHRRGNCAGAARRDRALTSSETFSTHSLDTRSNVPQESSQSGSVYPATSCPLLRQAEQTARLVRPHLRTPSHYALKADGTGLGVTALVKRSRSHATKLAACFRVPSTCSEIQCAGFRARNSWRLRAFNGVLHCETGGSLPGMGRLH